MRVRGATSVAEADMGRGVRQSPRKIIVAFCPQICKPESAEDMGKLIHNSFSLASALSLRMPFSKPGTVRRVSGAALGACPVGYTRLPAKTRVRTSVTGTAQHRDWATLAT